MKETFIIRTEWAEAIMELEPLDQATVFTNLFHFHSGNENLINLNNLTVKLVWRFIEPNLKRNIDTYDKRKVTSTQNGKLGGRPKIGENAEEKNLNNLNKPNQEPNNLTEPNETLSVLVPVSVLVSDNVIDSEKEIINESGVVPPPPHTPEKVLSILKNKKIVKNEYSGKYQTIDDLPPLQKTIDYHVCPELRLQVFRHIEQYPNKYPPDEIAKFVKYWSELNEDRNLPKWKITKQKTGTWQVASRLSTWINNNFSTNYGKSKQHISPIIEPRQGQEFSWTPRTA